MTLVVSAQHLLVQGQPVLKSVTGGADADDRLARLAILFDLFQLLAGNRQPAGKEQHNVTGIQVVQTRKIVVGFAKSAGAFYVVILFQEFLKRG